MPDLQSTDDSLQKPTNPQSNHDSLKNSNGCHNTPLNPASHKSNSNTGLSTNSTSVPETISATRSGAAARVNDANQGVAAEHATILPICQKLAARVNAFLESEPQTPLLKDVQNQTRVAMGVIDECLDRYSLEQISLSYNGGKDCLVLLILLLATLSSHPTIKTHPSRLQSVYIISPHPFPEVTTFVASSITDYKLDLTGYALPMKEGFSRYLEEKSDVRAILVGTRRTDPHGGSLTHFDQTDSGWPSFMRVHPVIDWHYREIWSFIRHLEIPYCPLYDRGYTSLGGTTDTHPNPALKEGSAGEFRPAYELQGEEADKEERLGRDF